MSTVKVKVSEVSHTTIQSSAGNDLNYVVLKGYDDTNSKGFSKRFFATKKDGSPTQNAQIADGLGPNDWVEVTMDNTSYRNVTSIKKITPPAGSSAPDQTDYKSNTSAPSSGGSKGGSGRSGDQLNRATALELAVACLASSDNNTPTVNTVIEIAERFETYIVHGTGKPSMTYTPSNNTPEDAQAEQDPNLEDVGDDDIPF